MTAQEFMATLASLYRDRPDDEVVSVGHWHRPGLRHPDLPDFFADVGVSVGEIRRMAKQ